MVDRAKQAQARFGINLPVMNYECDRKLALWLGWANLGRSRLYFLAGPLLSGLPDQAGYAYSKNTPSIDGRRHLESLMYCVSMQRSAPPDSRECQSALW